MRNSANPLPSALATSGKPLGAEDDQRHHEDDQKLGHADAEHDDLSENATSKGQGVSNFIRARQLSGARQAVQLGRPKGQQ